MLYISLLVMNRLNQIESAFFFYFVYFLLPKDLTIQGPVVQSIVNLTTSLRGHLVKYIPTTLSNTLLFFVGKM